MRRRRTGWGGIMRVTLAAAMAAGVLGGSEAAAQRGARVGQPAPEITGGPWLNSEPVSLAGLRSRVVFIEFWTYG